MPWLDDVCGDSPSFARVYAPILKGRTMAKTRLDKLLANVEYIDYAIYAKYKNTIKMPEE